MKRLLALICALLMLSSAAMAEDLIKIDYSAWGVDLPIVPEGETVTLKVMVSQTVENLNWDQVWFWKWCEEKMNIKFEVEQIPSASVSDRKNLMFASGDMPDIIFDMKLTTAEVVKYGTVEQQLLPINKYISEELTPNLYAWSQIVSYENQHAADGNMYIFPIIARFPFNGGNNWPIFINEAWLNEAGLAIPTTTEELLTALRTFKTNHPDCIPLGGSMKSNADRYMVHLQNGFGFQTRRGDPYGVQPAYYKNEKIVIPCATPEFKEYLVYLNTLYNEGLISPDLFTLEGTADNAMFAEGKYGAWAAAPFTVVNDAETCLNWKAVSTLLSANNSEYCCPQYARIQSSGIFINADTKYPEICMKFMDFFYSDLGLLYTWEGPMAGTEDTLGMVGGWYVDDENKIHYVDVENGKYTSDYGYFVGCVAPSSGARLNMASIRALDHTKFSKQGAMQLMAGKEPQPESKNMTNPTDISSYYAHVGAYTYAEKSIWPDYIYFDEDTAVAVTDLKTVIANYVEAEIAKFITGARSLDEFDTYLKELDKMGVNEYLQYYLDYFAE